MNAPAHPGRLLKRELNARTLSANRLALNIGVPSGRITDILNGRRSITADTAVRLGRYFGNSAQFWLDLQSRYDVAVVERNRGGEIPAACGQQMLRRPTPGTGGEMFEKDEVLKELHGRLVAAGINPLDPKVQAISEVVNAFYAEKTREVLQQMQAVLSKIET